MKKILFLIISAIVLVGCNNQEVKEEPNEPNLPKKPVESVEETGTDETVEEDSPVEEAIDEEVVPQYEINQGNWAVVPLEDADEQVVLLTFDDAPDKHARTIAKTLHELGVGAIFFVNGHFLDTEEEANTLREIHELGFLIGNHTFSHSKLTDISVDAQYEEIVSLNDRVEEIIGERPKFFRAPYGINTDEVRKIVADEGMVLMNWTYGYDWEKQYQDKDALADIMVNSPYLRNGANLLMHDRSWTSEAIEGIVKGLQAKGYEIVDPHKIRTQ